MLQKHIVKLMKVLVVIQQTERPWGLCKHKLTGESVAEWLGVVEIEDKVELQM